MMKKLLFVLFVFVGTIGFSQEVDSFTLSYQIGYKCSPEMDGKEKRGVCGRREEIIYEKKKYAYQIRSFETKDSFREWGGNWEISQDSVTRKEIKNWVGGFGPNLIKDSLDTTRLLIKRKINGKALNEFLQSFIAIQSDTLFPYTTKDIPESYLKNHSLSSESNKKQVDSLLHDEFSGLAMSNVMGYIFLSFNYNEESYHLNKDINNIYWTLYHNHQEGNESIRFIYFAFDAFLREELPKKFSGTKVLD